MARGITWWKLNLTSVLDCLQMLNNDLNSCFFCLIELSMTVLLLAQLGEFDRCDNLCLFRCQVVVGRTNGCPINQIVCVGILLLIQTNFPLRVWELMVLALVVSSPKYTQNLPFSLPYLVSYLTSNYYKKKLQSGSPLASLSKASDNSVVAIFHKKLDMGSRSRCDQNPFKIYQNRKI